MSTISVIVPVYNVEKYLARCLDSILNQTFTDFEVICVNDGSKDGSSAILQDYAQKDARIIVLDQENQGLSMARNNGMKVAQGEYISFVDSDDAIEPQLMEIAHGLITKHQADMVCWNLKTSEGIETPHSTFDIDTIQAIVTHSFLMHKCMNGTLQHYVCINLYKKNLITNHLFIPNMYYEDIPWIQTLVLQNPKAVIIPHELYHYTKNITSITRQKPTPYRIKSRLKALQLSSTILNKPEFQKEFSLVTSASIHPFLAFTTKEIARSHISEQLPLWFAFEEELRDLDAKGLMPPYDKKKKEHRAYQYILQHGAKAYYEKEILYWYKKPFHLKKDKISMTYYIFGMKIFAKEKLSEEKRAIHILGMTFTYTKK